MGDLGPVYTERERQYCDVAIDIALFKFLRFVKKTNESLKNSVAT